MSDYVPSPTFSDRVKKRKSTDEKAEEPKILKPSGPPFPDVVRSHRLPLVLKSKSGDSLQVYLISYAKKDENGQLTYDVEFDDGTVKESVPRAALSVPASTSYQIMRLQESQQCNETPPRQRKRR